MEPFQRGAIPFHFIQIINQISENRRQQLCLNLSSHFQASCYLTIDNLPL